MAITLTENAANHIKKVLAKRAGVVALRLGVKKVGCSGMAYTFDYADKVGAQDHLFESHDAKVVVDGESLPFLDGSVLDFVKDGFKETFKFENPNIKGQCGCGESFNV
ncbi:MAG: HesB/IscA family protein [Burkholderiales bacterium]